MAPMPGLQEQNPYTNTVRNGAYKFSAVLPEVQAGNFGKRPTIKIINR
jgi:hypothetical protein